MTADIAYQNALIDHEETIIRFLQGQLEEGITGTGEPTMLYDSLVYHPKTIENKKRRSGIAGITDVITLYGRGHFYDNMYTIVKKGEAAVRSKVSYYTKIVERSGMEVMDLTDENTTILMEEYINPQVRQEVEEALRGV